MESDERSRPSDVISEYFSELKKADRARLMALPPDDAQAAVERILYPRLWQIADPEQLIWRGDLADNDEDV